MMASGAVELRAQRSALAVVPISLMGFPLGPGSGCQAPLFIKLNGSVPARIWPMRAWQATNQSELDRKKSMRGAPAAHVQAAVQHLTWALEEIEKTGSKEAAHHVRNALHALRQNFPSTDLKSTIG
jgi:hypothetical protein